MLKLKFDWRDILRAPRLALSLQRMWIQLLGFTVGYLFYLIFTYAAFAAAGLALETAWLQSGLLPCLFTVGESLPWWAWLLYAVGCLMLFSALMIANTAAARAIYMTSKGNSFYSWKESYRFAFRKAASVLLTPISLVVIIGLMVLGALVVGLLGKIPFVGELGVSLFAPLWVLSALLLLFLAIVAVVSAVLAPSIIAATDEDAFEAVFQSFSMCWGRPWRFFFYESLTVVLSLASIAGLGFFIKQAVVITNRLFAAFMGADYINLSNNGQALLQGWTLPAQGLIDHLYGRFADMIFFAREFVMIPSAQLPVSVVISSYIFAVGLLFLAGWVVSYGLAAFTAGNTLLVLVIKKHKDDENLLERKDAEEETEEEAKAEESPAAEETPTVKE